MKDETLDTAFAPFAEKMAGAGLPEVAIRNFRRHYAQLAQGESGLIPEVELEVVRELPDAETLPGELGAVRRRFPDGDDQAERRARHRWVWRRRTHF
jgi:hypothetical protein